jgi:hypothetical protein
VAVGETGEQRQQRGLPSWSPRVERDDQGRARSANQVAAEAVTLQAAPATKPAGPQSLRGVPCSSALNSPPLVNRILSPEV